MKPFVFSKLEDHSSYSNVQILVHAGRHNIHTHTHTHRSTTITPMYTCLKGLTRYGDCSTQPNKIGHARIAGVSLLCYSSSLALS